MNKKENIFIDSLADNINNNRFKNCKSIDVQDIIKIVYNYKKKDLSVFSVSFLKNIINNRLKIKKLKSFADYKKFISNNIEEIDILLKSVNVSYSIFFRNIVDYSMIEKIIFPIIFDSKKHNNASSVRIWSVACSKGQEPYSLSIIANDLLYRQYKKFSVQIIATDISDKSISKSIKGEYNTDEIQNIRLSHLKDYFTKKDDIYFVNDKIKSKVKFIQYDILDEKNHLPMNEIFTGYDMIICCNLMIYYRPKIQKFILDKIYRALNSNGYLLVDESEKSIVESYDRFKNFCSIGNIFIKS